MNTPREGKYAHVQAQIHFELHTGHKNLRHKQEYKYTPAALVA